MFPVYVIDDSKNIPSDDICFLISDKIYLKKKTDIVESLIPIEDISFKDPIIPYAKLHIKKIPEFLVSKILQFFKWVSEEFNSEAIVLLFYNPKTKKYKILVPNQEVSFASIKYTPVITPKDYILLSSIHSHNTFSAFHSGTDIHDEEGFDGLHITFGNLNEDDFSISASIVINNMRFLVNPLDYLNGIKEVSELRKEVKDKYISFISSRTQFQKYKLTSNKKYNIQENWMSKVIKRIPKFSRRNYNTLAEKLLYSSFDDIYEAMKLNDVNNNEINNDSLILDNYNIENEEIIDLSKYINVISEKEESNKFDPCFNCPFNKYREKEDSDLRNEKEY